MLDLMKRAVWEEDANYDNATLITLIVGTCLVLIMCFGLAYLYAGLARRKSALHLIFIVFMSILVAQFQWYFWGYSLAFSTTSTNKFIGNVHHFAYQHLTGIVQLTDSDGYPEMAFANFQGMFSTITLCILSGAICERGRVVPMLILSFGWLTIVYCPVAYWVWGSGGWAYKWGVLDYAGGGPVEILSGFGGFVISYFLGQRKEHLMINYRPHNVSLITIGTCLLWFGWLGFNGLTCIKPSLKSVYAIMNTNLCAALGGFTWCLLDYRINRHFSAVGMCSGIISGLVAATPSSGVIPLWASVILGITAGIVCNFSTKVKVLLRTDDSLDILAEHGIAGVLGLIFNGFFASSKVLGYDGYTDHPGGWYDQNWKQMYKQIAYIFAVIGYCMAVTAVLCFVINKIPGLHLRIDEEGEENGMDETEIGEFAYDYVEVRRNFFDVNTFGSGEEEVISSSNQLEEEKHHADPTSKDGNSSS